MSSKMTTGEELSSLKLEQFGRVPAMHFRLLSSGRVVFRYTVDDARKFPGFDGEWREMSEAEKRETIRMGGRVADWLRSIEDAAKK